jgi:hypothetical protein
VPGPTLVLSGTTPTERDNAMTRSPRRHPRSSFAGAVPASRRPGLVRRPITTVVLGAVAGTLLLAASPVPASATEPAGSDAVQAQSAFAGGFVSELGHIAHG